MKECPKNSILFVFDNYDNIISIINKGEIFVNPLTQSYKIVSLTPIKIDLKLKDILTKNRTTFNLYATFFITIFNDLEFIKNIKLIKANTTLEDIKNDAKTIIENKLLTIFSTLTASGNTLKQNDFLQQVYELLANELKLLGFELKRIAINEIKLISEYIETPEPQKEPQNKFKQEFGQLAQKEIEEEKAEEIPLQNEQKTEQTAEINQKVDDISATKDYDVFASIRKYFDKNE